MSIRPLLALAAIAAPAALAAQLSTTVSPTAPRVGIMAGLSSATLSGNDVNLITQDAGVDKKRRNGFVAGVYAVLPLAGSPVSLRPELLYAQKGVKFSGGGADAAVKLDYLEVPVLLQFNVPNTAGLRPALYLGPSVAYRVACNVEGTDGSTRVNTGCNNSDVDISDKKFDVSGVIGGQLSFALGGQSVGVGVRYTQGFKDIHSDVDAKNRAFSAYGSIEFPFGR